MTEHQEWGLIEKCKSGDVAAYTELVKRYQRAVYNCTFRILNNREDAADATQTAFLRLYERIGSFDSNRSFFSWIYRIAINVAIDQRRRIRPADSIQEDRIESILDDPEENLEKSESKKDVQSALMKLSFDARIVLILRHYSEFSYKQMSDVLEIPEKTVRSRLYSSRQQLKDLLQETREPT